MKILKYNLMLFLFLTGSYLYSMELKTYHSLSGYTWKETDIVLTVHNKEKSHQKSKNRLVINGYCFSTHVQKRMQQRGISVEDILSVLKDGKKTTIEKGILSYYIRKIKTAVVLDEDMKIILTAYKTNTSNEVKKNSKE